MPQTFNNMSGLNVFMKLHGNMLLYSASTAVTDTETREKMILRAESAPSLRFVFCCISV